MVTKISGEKTWDQKNRSLTLPESITVNLKNGGTLVNTAVVTPDKDGKWLYTFDAPKYDRDSRDVVYTVEEEPIESWRSSYDGYDIKNTYIPPVVLSDPPVKKVLEGDEPPEDAQFRFKMSGLDGAPMPPGSSEGVKIMTVTGEGEAEFGDMTFTQAGTYVYTVTEINTQEEGYTYDASVYTLTVVVTEENGELKVSQRNLEMDGEARDEIVFTNHYDAPYDDKTIIISGTKTWEYDGTAPEDYPESITILVEADGEVVLQRQITENDGWSWSFQMDKYDADGNEIEYAIDEADVPGYEKTIEGYDITNTYVVADDPVTPSVPPNTNTPPNTNNPGKPTSPQTGDDSNARLWWVVMLASVLGILSVLVWRKYRQVKGTW
jgi:pilin isopeptide linkage protein